MASSLSLFSLFVVLLVAASATATREVKNFDDIKLEVNRVCSRTRNPGFCNGVLRGREQQSLELVSGGLINEAMGKATDVYNLISTLIPRATNAQKGHLNNCQRLYDSAANDIDAATALFGHRDYSGVNRKAGVIAKYANTCESSFSTLPPAPSPITQQNSDFFNLVDVLSATTYLLSHP